MKGQEEIYKLYEHMDMVKQCTRNNFLEIEGISENVCNDRDAKVAEIAEITEILNVNVKGEDIDICHRIKRKKTRPIIARFVSHKVKSYKQQVQLKTISFSQLFPSASPTAKALSNCVFIKEYLTPHR